ncbi:MAG: hypothetical protein ABI142_00980 [Bryocella sp.]
MITATTIRTLLALAAVSVMSCVGCEAKQIGVAFSDKQAEKVDNTWVTAARSCWPALAHGYDSASLKRYIADPMHFRAAFGTYSTLSDEQLRGIVLRPVTVAPTPDASILTSSQTPVMTRYQAVSGFDSANATANTTDSAAPPDALCAIHPGVPVGFR